MGLLPREKLECMIHVFIFYDADKLEAADAGCTAYLTKPIDGTLLKETLRFYLSQK